MKPDQNSLQVKNQSSGRFSLYACLALFVAAAFVWSGCKREGQVATTAVADPAGTYTLASVDGKPLPCTIQHEGQSPTIRSGTFVFNSDGTCVSSIAFSIPSGGDASRQVKAAFTRSGSTLTMRWEGAGVTTGTIDGDMFTMNNEGMVLAYRK